MSNSSLATLVRWTDGLLAVNVDAMLGTRIRLPVERLRYFSGRGSKLKMSEFARMRPIAIFSRPGCQQTDFGSGTSGHAFGEYLDIPVYTNSFLTLSADKKSLSRVCLPFSATIPREKPP